MNGGSTGAAEFCGLSNRDCKHIRKDTRSSTGLCANSLWLRDNTCACHGTSLYCTYGLTKSPSHTAVLICERPGCTRPLLLASSPKDSVALVLALCCI
ncbi:unnamed protein product [Staurois parvus]|uniref:Uncharacterized protein n=1 Tax=Staurois parvus TaxID=386267 RepID=A0ABN9CVK3_9NEOB|nr:unnamed protein product [Staurois parvus]